MNVVIVVRNGGMTPALGGATRTAKRSWFYARRGNTQTGQRAGYAFRRPT